MSTTRTPEGLDADGPPAAAASTSPRPPRPRSLRRQLLTGILLPVLAVMAVSTWSLYRQALAAANTAYDRTLLASAKTISEQLEVDGYDEQARLRVLVPFSALEAFENDNQSHLVYRVSSLGGEAVSGYTDLPPWRGRVPARPAYAALVDFYDDTYHGEPVRVAALLQPVASASGRGMAVIQVAETLELREALARRILHETLARQALLVAVIAAVVIWVVQRATRPVRELSAALPQRPEGDLTPIAAPGAPRELAPLVDATNTVMARLAWLLEHRKRFVRDAAHQLRTPLAVLKTQVQSALRGDMPPRQALEEINDTVDRATTLANQMLSLAKVEQLRQQDDAPVLDLSDAVRRVALDLSPLIAGQDLDFAIDTVPAPVRAHAWMLEELARNLLHNAIRHCPDGGALTVRVLRDGTTAALVIADSGRGLDAELARRLFQPFAAGEGHRGTGLGLTICREICEALGGHIALDNRLQGTRVTGLDATVRLPLADTRAATARHNAG